MKVMVTGGAGFLGRRIVAVLAAMGHQVHCLVRPDSEFSCELIGAANVRVIRGTLSDRCAVSDAMAGCEVVFHAAAALSGATSILFANNVVATRELAIRAIEADVRRFVLVSSLAVYGTGHLRAGALLDENCPREPLPHLRDPYTYSKVEQESAAEEAARGSAMELVIVRPGVIYGPGRSCISARVGLQMGRWLLRMGGGQQLPYLFVENAADAIVRAGLVPGIGGQVFNLVDEQPGSGRYLLKRYRRHGGRRLRVIPVPLWGLGPLSHLCQWYHEWSGGQLPSVLTPYKSSAMWKPLRFSNGKAVAVLQWRPQHSFEDALELTLKAATSEPVSV
jgi:nucleoside-diphosphate-sugar epimerase